MEGQQLSVQETAFRTEFSTPNFHKAHLAIGDPVPGQRSKDYRLPGRLSGTRPVQTGAASSHETGVRYSKESGFSEKPQEVSLGAKTALRVSWSPVGYEGAKGLPTRGQGQRLQAVRTHSTLQPQSSLGPKIFGQGNLCSPCGTVGPDVLATTSDGSNKGVKVGSFIDARESIRWWTLPPMNGMDLTPYNTHIAMTKDASNYGWGATMEEKMASGRWSAAERELHINHSELSAVFRGIQRFLRHLRNKRVTVHLDNVTAAAYLAKEGGTRSDHVKHPNKGDQDLLQKPRYYTQSSLSTRYSKLGNRRLFQRDRDEGMIYQSEGLGEDHQSFRTPTDGFICIKEIGSGEDVLLPRQERPSFDQTNALNQPWTFKHMYAFPPSQIIPLILARVRECKGTLVLVTSFWSRTAWLPELLHMSVQAPFRLLQLPNTVRNLSTGSPSHHC